jgi:adenine deaminase
MFHVERFSKCMNKTENCFGNLVDLFTDEIYPAEIVVEDGLIVSIHRTPFRTNSFILPGLIDSHIHVESSMLTPQHFGRLALSHGTIAVVSDPHEIANVLGVEGVKYMIENADGSDLKFFFGAPSCVPATNFESSGAKLTPEDIEYLFKKQNLLFLSEVMNYPGVIYGDKDIFEKILIAKRYNRKIDGHAPGLLGPDLQKYIDAGIQTDHECSGLEEAVEKINRGMIIQIREGSAAKNFEALWTLIDKYPDKVFLCSDDLHPDDLVKGHINILLRKGIEKGVNLFNLLRSVTLNPINHYQLKLGILRVGDNADFIRVDDLVSFNVSETYISGKKVYDRNIGLPKLTSQKIINKFYATAIEEKSIMVPPDSNHIKVISVEDGELLTKSFTAFLKTNKFDLSSDLSQDIIKLVVLNRYKSEPPAVAFIHNFNLKKGAMASSIAHDSHNIIALGVNNKEITECINWIITNKGGIAIHNGSTVFGIPLPIAGIISDQDAEDVSTKSSKINRIAKEIGCSLKAPFMTLSFMALLVIPELKLSNMGLFDGKNFAFTSLYEY